MPINQFFTNPFGANVANAGANPSGIMADPPVRGSGLFGSPGSPQSDAMMAVAASLLAGSGYSPVRRSSSEILGQALLAGQQARAAAQDRIQKQQYQQAQMDALEREKNQDPNSVREYEYARQNGFNGSFQDWITAGGQSSRPSSVQEWEFFSGLKPDQQQRYLEMKRNPNMFVRDVNTTPTAIVGTPGGGVSTTALSTPQSEANAAEQKKRQESAGAARGTAEGNVAGGIVTKGANAVSTKGMLDVAEPLIDIATGSATGAARDAVAKVFGGSTDGANAIAKLKVLQAGLMTSMPRMEGPQSDRDVMLYREAAGQIGDSTVPAEQKKAAVETIRQIQDRYIDRAAQQSGGKPPAAGKRVRVDAQGNVIGN